MPVASGRYCVVHSRASVRAWVVSAGRLGTSDPAGIGSASSWATDASITGMDCPVCVTPDDKVVDGLKSGLVMAIQ